MKRLLVTLLVLCASGGALAHEASDSYLSLSQSREGWSGRWDIALRDLEHVLGLDANGDGAITWGELSAQEPVLAEYAFSRLTVSAGGEACELSPAELQVDRHRNVAYAVLGFELRCVRGTLLLDYALLFDVDATHRGLLRVEHGGRTETGVLAPERPRFEIGSASRLAAFGQYWREGVWHIWIGFDHILFLIALLLPAVLTREGGQWRQARSFRAAFWDVVAVVTAFTVAHTLTLTLAALQFVAVPARWVESVIAATVLAAALNNLFPLLTRRRALVAFALGLAHGFGFAGVLQDLGLPSSALALALAGFNLGVETGQLAIVAAFLPVAYLLRGGWLYRRVVLQGGSAAVALIAAAWLLERSLGLHLLPL